MLEHGAKNIVPRCSSLWYLSLSYTTTFIFYTFVQQPWMFTGLTKLLIQVHMIIDIRVLYDWYEFTVLFWLPIVCRNISYIFTGLVGDCWRGCWAKDKMDKRLVSRLKNHNWLYECDNINKINALYVTNYLNRWVWLNWRVYNTN